MMSMADSDTVLFETTRRILLFRFVLLVGLWGGVPTKKPEDCDSFSSLNKVTFDGLAKPSFSCTAEPDVLASPSLSLSLHNHCLHRVSPSQPQSHADDRQSI